MRHANANLKRPNTNESSPRYAPKTLARVFESNDVAFGLKMNLQSQIPAPNISDITEQLYALFAPAFVNSHPNACVEIAYGHPHTGNVNEAKVFSAFELAEAADAAAKLNALGYNVYVGPALRTYGEREVPPDRRAKEENYLASAFAWVDFDGPGDAERVEVLLQQHGLRPTLVVTTGTVPHRRGQMLFRVSDIKDAVQQKQINETLGKLLGTDPNVVGAVHVMRLGGSVSYPPERKVQRGYTTELTQLHKIVDAPTYGAAQLLALGGSVISEPTDPFTAYAEQNGRKTGKSNEELISLLKQSRATPGKGWREPMLRFIGSTVAKGWSDLQIKLACSPYSDGGIDDPDIEKEINYARKKFGKPDDSEGTDLKGNGEADQNQPKGMASSALALIYYNELSNPPPKYWIIKNVLARGETSNWFGPPGVGKSVLLTDLAFHIAAGLDWRGKRSKERCGVVYLALERGALVKRRLSAYMREYDARDLPIAIASSVIDLKNNRCVKLILDAIRDAEARFGCKVGLIVIDTFSKGIAAGGGDEDKAKDQNMVSANLRRIQERSNVHIAVIGHPGKDESRGHRGSKAHMGDVDLMVQIKGDGAIKTATIIKINDGQEGHLTHYKIEVANLGVDEDNDPITTAMVSCELAEADEEAKSRRGLTPTQRRAIEQLTRCINDQGRPAPPSNEYPANIRVVSLDEWGVMCERGGLSSAKAEKDRDRVFRRAKDDLQTSNRIACLDGLVWLVRDDV
jgi:hypothetical protein